MRSDPLAPAKVTECFWCDYATGQHILSLSAGEGEFDGVDLFKPTSAFLQTAENLRMKYPGWKLNNVSEKEMFAVDAGVSTA